MSISRRNARHDRHQTAGFTLIELLVVMSVIAVLVAILLPALQRARGAALTTNCISNVRQFGLAINMYVEETTQFPPHQQSNLNPDGMLMPNWWNLTDGGNYIEDKNIMLCPAAPLHDYPFKYQESSNAYDKSSAYWSRFWSPGRGAGTMKADGKMRNPGYNGPMGTYYYWGGAAYRNSPETRAWEVWPSHKDTPFRTHFIMRQQHVGDASKYAIIWDHDIWRNYLHGRPEQMPHMRYRPGRSFGFFDGHVEFHPYVSSNDNASWITPILLTEGTVRYKGINYTDDSFTSGKVDGILRLPVKSH